jgi:hypothetical protein
MEFSIEIPWNSVEFQGNFQGIQRNSMENVTEFHGKFYEIPQDFIKFHINI